MKCIALEMIRVKNGPHAVNAIEAEMGTIGISAPLDGVVARGIQMAALLARSLLVRLRQLKKPAEQSKDIKGIWIGVIALIRLLIFVGGMLNQSILGTDKR